MLRYNLGANSDIGIGRKLQEDFISYKEYENDLFAVIADGTGTSDDRLQPAVVATNSMINEITAIKEENDELFKKDPMFFLKRAMLNANSILGIMKISNEELYHGYAASMSAIYFSSEGRMYFVHAGNTRIYLLRDGRLTQMTEDHTVAMQRVNEGELSMDHYYLTEDRLKVTSGVGLNTEPEIYTLSGNIKPNDIFVMTTDGIHYALTPQNMVEVILNSDGVVDAAEKLVYAAKNFVQYPDNMAAFVIGAGEAQ